MTDMRGGGSDPQQYPYQQPDPTIQQPANQEQPNPYAPVSGASGLPPYGTPGQPMYSAGPYGGQQPTGLPVYPSQQDAPYPGFTPQAPSRSKTPIIVGISVVVVLAIVGAVSAVVLLNRGDKSPTGDGGSASSAPAVGGKPGWQNIEVEEKGVKYQVPPGWKPESRDYDSGIGVTFTGGAVTGLYNCGGTEYFRGFTAVGEASDRNGKKLVLNKVISAFADTFIQNYYREGPVERGEVVPRTLGKTSAASLVYTVTPTPQSSSGPKQCAATRGAVAIIGALDEQSGLTDAVRMLVVVYDLAGGPAEPPALTDQIAQEILSTFTSMD